MPEQQKVYLDPQGNEKKIYLDAQGNIAPPTKIAEKTFPGAVNIAKKIGENLPSGSTIASTIGGAGAGFLSGSPLVGSATMIAIKNLIDNTPEQNAITLPNVGRFALDTALNEITGRLFSGAGKVGREIISPGSVMPEELRQLLPFKPTAAQLTNSNVLNLIENAFAGKSKQAALGESANIINQKGENFLTQLTGRKNVTLNEPFKQAINIQKDIENAFDASKIESNARGAKANLIASANVIQVPSQNGIRTITGPIEPRNLLREASSLKATLNKSQVPPDPNGPLMRTLDLIINANQETDANGVVKTKLQDFGDMWATKQAIDDIAYANPKSKAEFADTRFKQLSKALNQDIETSMALWQNNGPQAQRFFQEAKQIVAKRHELIESAPIEKLINEEPKEITAVNQIIDDPSQLKKALISGKLQIPNQGGFTYITNNTRKDLQGYELQRLINSVKSVDDKGNVSFDGEKLLNSFKNPLKQESYKALYSAQNRADIEQFFKNIAQVQQKGQVGMSRYWIMRLVGNGLGLSAGLLSGMGTIPGQAIIGGTIGLNALGKLLTNPSTARIMVSAAQGGPLNMPTMVASRAIANVLRNTPIVLKYTDGNEVEGRINSEGKVSLPVR